MTWLADTRAWRADREAYIASEGLPHFDDRGFADYDDAAVHLLNRVAQLPDLDVLRSAWLDVATHFTCTEADVLVPLLTLLHGDDFALHSLVAHAHGDEADDDPDHLHLKETRRP